jgi:hypothetical protein
MVCLLRVPITAFDDALIFAGAEGTSFKLSLPVLLVFFWHFIYNLNKLYALLGPFLLVCLNPLLNSENQFGPSKASLGTRLSGSSHLPSPQILEKCIFSKMGETAALAVVV